MYIEIFLISCLPAGWLALTRHDSRASRLGSTYYDFFYPLLLSLLAVDVKVDFNVKRYIHLKFASQFRILSLPMPVADRRDRTSHKAQLPIANCSYHARLGRRTVRYGKSFCSSDVGKVSANKKRRPELKKFFLLPLLGDDGDSLTESGLIFRSWSPDVANMNLGSAPSSAE